MLRMLSVAVAVFWLMVMPPLVSATPSKSLYSLSITRVGDNAYRDMSSQLVLITSYCYEYAYGDDAVLDDAHGGSKGRLIFSSGTTCDVKGIYRSNANITRTDQDIYKDTSSQRFLRTRYCYVYAYSEDVLILSDTVIFLDSEESCDIAR